MQAYESRSTAGWWVILLFVIAAVVMVVLDQIDRADSRRAADERRDAVTACYESGQLDELIEQGGC